MDVLYMMVQGTRRVSKGVREAWKGLGRVHESVKEVVEGQGGHAGMCEWPALCKWRGSG